MEFRLPKQSEVNKFIPKNSFFSKAVLSTRIKDEFTDSIQRITWRYKIAESTVGIQKTANVEEFQIFELELKEQSIPQNVLKVIDKLIPYPILYVFTYGENFAYGITIKDDPSRKYYFSEWNEPIDFDFHAPNIEMTYQNCIKRFIRRTGTEEKDFDSIVETDRRIEKLQTEIQTLKNKIRSEIQFNKKVELNKILQARTEELQTLNPNLIISS